ncbi:TPA: radical SAM protein [Pseudomonas aeruginosa]|uniref:B12-binding domain-containing radical SAM protein n=1 Tax=Pseudomonas aeruginosa TaxID=287 RepID=UPI0010671D28|nr:radical SAM protein [Pseudomonas aeruginosa]MCS9384883.1 radical SAM protein [Pseudomonas aeruginosa]TEB69986.1 radical SAM protein [Pseudomonas aeruginosa]HEJ1250062.1 radical SAM protein [Pseudomonas aeruginosa]HEJ3894635.1 radical SAM protein [Pseudomonas aeruginosa]
MSRVICISAGQLQVKKADTPINRRHQYLNYGLLSLATVLQRHGFDPVVLHGHFERPESLLLKAENLGLDKSLPVLISLPSFYAVEWADLFMRQAKALYPSLRFIVGGRWVVGDNPERLKALLPLADRVIAGLAEWQIVELLGGTRNATGLLLGSPASQSSILDYRLLHQRELYQPSIEVSRGCGMGCSFCQERSERLQPLKPASQVVEELGATLLRDNLIEMTPYFEASMFVPTKGWVADFAEALSEAELELRWRSEGRVDNIRPELMADLAATGLTVLDLGLESASLQQLQRMQKSKKPQGYLDRASRLLEACAVNGIKVKVNLLMFAGETDDSLAETLNWLDARKDQFHGVSVGPVIVYGWPQESESYLNELSAFGASLSHSPCFGVNHLNLSPQMSHARALAVSREISQRYMDAEHYYQLKSFSYFARDYRYPDFLEDVANTSVPLSFDTSRLTLPAREGRHSPELTV